MNNRIKEIRIKKGISQKALANMIGVSDAAVSKIESGTNNPSDRTVKLIVDKLGVNEHWLRTGEGEPFVEQLPPSDMDLLAQMVQQKGGNEMILSIMRCWLKMDPVQREVLSDFINEVAAEYQSAKLEASGSQVESSASDPESLRESV